MSKSKIIGSDKVAKATRYFSGRQALNRALCRERDKFLNIYGGDPNDPESCLFWYKARGEEPISYVHADKKVRSSRKWSLCSTAERAAAFGAAMRSNKEEDRPAIAAYLDAASPEHRAKIVKGNPWLPLLVRMRQIREDLEERRFRVDWDNQQQPFDEPR